MISKVSFARISILIPGGLHRVPFSILRWISKIMGLLPTCPHRYWCITQYSKLFGVAFVEPSSTKWKVQGSNPGLGSQAFENETVHAELTIHVQPICAIEITNVIKWEKIQPDLNFEVLGYSCPMKFRKLASNQLPRVPYLLLEFAFGVCHVRWQLVSTLLRPLTLTSFPGGSGTPIPMPKLFKDLGVQTDNIFFHCAQSTEAANKAIRVIRRSLPDLSK